MTDSKVYKSVMKAAKPVRMGRIPQQPPVQRISGKPKQVCFRAKADNGTEKPVLQ